MYQIRRRRMFSSLQRRMSCSVSPSNGFWGIPKGFTERIGSVCFLSGHPPRHWLSSLTLWNSNGYYRHSCCYTRSGHGRTDSPGLSTLWMEWEFPGELEQSNYKHSNAHLQWLCCLLFSRWLLVLCTIIMSSHPSNTLSWVTMENDSSGDDLSPDREWISSDDQR